MTGAISYDVHYDCIEKPIRCSDKLLTLANMSYLLLKRLMLYDYKITVPYPAATWLADRDEVYLLILRYRRCYIFEPIVVLSGGWLL